MANINWPLIISLLVALIASVGSLTGTIIQAHTQRRLKAMEMYFSSQLKAYSEFLTLCSLADSDLKHGETRDFSPIIGAAQTAMLLSTHENAKAISKACTASMNFVSANDAGAFDEALTEEYGIRLNAVSVALRNEIFRFDTTRKRK